MIKAVRASTKRRDYFESVTRQVVSSGAISQAVHLTTYNTETRWSSTFHIFNQA